MSETIVRDILRYRTALKLPGHSARAMPTDFGKASRAPEVFGAPIASSDALFDNAYGRINGDAKPLEAPLYHYTDEEGSDAAVLALFGGLQGNLQLHIVHAMQALAWFGSPDGAGDLPLAGGGDDVRLLCYVPSYMGQFQKVLAVWDRSAQGFRLHTLKWGKGPETLGIAPWSNRTYLLAGSPVRE